MPKLEFRDFLLVALFGYIVFIQMCQSEPNLPDLPDTVVVNYTPPPVVVNLPPSPSPKIIYQPIPADIDSHQIAQAYFSQVEYNDTVRTDSAEVYVKEIVSRNAIQSRLVGFKWTVPPCSTVTITKPPVMRNKVYVGGSLSYQIGEVDLNLIGAWQNKRDQIVFAGYSPLSQSIQLGAMVKIKLQ